MSLVEQYWPSRLNLPEDHRKIELIDGSYLVTPHAGTLHQQVCRRLANAVEKAAPAELEVVMEANLRLKRDRFLIPDLLVARLGEPRVFTEASEAVLVGEVVSPNPGIDRVLKPNLYAEAAVPWFLRVELENGPELLLFELDDGSYRLAGRGFGDEPLTLPPPLEGTIRPGDLLRR